MAQHLLLRLTPHGLDDIHFFIVLGVHAESVELVVGHGSMQLLVAVHLHELG